ncbi:hypothetical protein M436DRAFT_61734 [Aureobasidium namibiae CBS 147.97]|uniref:Uncharacterized protein n=1 Tax=Aureobasidium namibiae CBS 147.97 TaxID=1043004 RepID=A0A074WUU5_9PEZI|nr:uncharacterized protein M436DRAFT_61734 [Aureobasidium namibiae CBS 147.97]KEQ75319.1 hypothetical protein M436DRAFT_61734 [Aureobasidium namibiae CBS 147.97]
MPSPRNSRFIENFDDSSESPSPESNSTAPFPDCTSGFSLPTQIIQQFSAMGLRNTSPRGSDHNNGTTSQPQSPVQVQTPTQPQAPATTQHSKSEAADVRSMKSSTMLVDDLILSLELGTDKTSNQPSSGATPPQIQINSESQPARDGEDLPEELNDGIDGQSEPESETSASSSSSKQGTSTLYRTGARSLHWYRALRGGQNTTGSRSKVVLRENVINPVHQQRPPGVLCLLIALVRRRARTNSRPPSAYSVLLTTQQPDSSDMTDRQSDSEQNEPINPVRLKSIDFIKTAVDDFFEDIQTERGIHPDTLTENFNALHQHLQHFRKVRDATARKFQRCYSSHARTKTSPADCDDCHMYLAQIEHGYTGACANIMSMMTELRKGIWTSVMKANFHREIEESVNTLARGGLFVHDVNLQRLEETKGMLQSLEDDAEAAKGWPQVSLNDAPPEDGQASKKTKEDEDTGNDGTKSSQVKSKKGKSKEQKKKKKGKR